MGRVISIEEHGDIIEGKGRNMCDKIESKEDGEWK